MLVLASRPSKSFLLVLFGFCSEGIKVCVCVRAGAGAAVYSCCCCYFFCKIIKEGRRPPTWIRAPVVHCYWDIEYLSGIVSPCLGLFYSSSTSYLLLLFSVFEKSSCSLLNSCVDYSLKVVDCERATTTTTCFVLSCTPERYLFSLSLVFFFSFFPGDGIVAVSCFRPIRPMPPFSSSFSQSEKEARPHCIQHV